jgi:predicted Zn finger-like uncharacterized protein
MIVVCSTCQARFKVADEKIGPRGAKVRCSKCQTVFVVHRDLGVMPAEPEQAAPPAPRPAPGGLDLDLEAEPRSGVRPSGFVANPFARAQPPSAPAAAAPAPHDPYGAADPFAGHAAPPPGGEPDPFAAHDAMATAAPSAGAFGSVDPFVATVAGAGPGLPTSAVTDLSDLLGGARSVPAPMEAPAVTPPPEPSGILETGFDFDPGASPEPAPFPSHAPSAGGAEPDLALAERTPSSAMPVQPAPPVPMPGFGDFAGADPFGDEGGLGGAELDAFAGGPELVEPPPQHAPPPPPAHPEAPPPAAAAEPQPAAASEPAEGPEEAAAEGLRHRSSRVRAIAVNAISLVALLAVVLGMLAFWRGVRPGAGGLHPAAFLGAIKGGEEEPFTADGISSGLYDRADAAPVLFVSGSAVSRAPAAVPGLRVRVELLQKGAVVGQGEARAGAIPTPEELSATRDAAGVAAVAGRLAERAPGVVKPGDSVPFLVAISDYPSDVAGVGLRVTVEPLGAASSGGGAQRP